MKKSHLKLLFLMICCNFCYAQKDCTVRLIRKIDIPNGNAEIIQYNSAKNIIIATNSKNHYLDFYKINELSTGDIQPIANIKINSEPTSVAAKDNFDYVILSKLKDSNGISEIIFADMNSFIETKKISFGIQLDSVAISPNGKWLIVADEAEENHQTPGAIWALNLLSPRHNNMLPVRLDGMDKLTGIDLGILEPEFVAFDPNSKFAAISCQENDLVVITDLQNSQPTLTGVIKLTKGAQPDGVAVIRELCPSDDNVIIAVAEEGEKDIDGKRTGQCVSFYSLAEDLKKYELLSRIDVRKYLCPEEPDKRCDPEGIALAVMRNRIFTFVGIEKLNKLLVLEITNPRNPVFVTAENTGLRPEGVIAFEKNGKIYILTADEGGDSSGSLCIFEMNLDSMPR
jgi:hypothetical protein